MRVHGPRNAPNNCANCECSTWARPSYAWAIYAYPAGVGASALRVDRRDIVVLQVVRVLRDVVPEHVDGDDVELCVRTSRQHYASIGVKVRNLASDDLTATAGDSGRPPARTASVQGFRMSLTSWIVVPLQSAFGSNPFQMA